MNANTSQITIRNEIDPRNNLYAAGKAPSGWVLRAAGGEFIAFYRTREFALLRAVHDRRPFRA